MRGRRLLVRVLAAVTVRGLETFPFSFYFLGARCCCLPSSFITLFVCLFVCCVYCTYSSSEPLQPFFFACFVFVFSLFLSVSFQLCKFSVLFSFSFLSFLCSFFSFFALYFEPLWYIPYIRTLPTHHSSGFLAHCRVLPHKYSSIPTPNDSKNRTSARVVVVAVAVSNLQFYITSYHTQVS